MGRHKRSKTNYSSSTLSFHSNADMVFQNFDMVLYIKEFIPSKYALPYYLVCKCTMSTARNKDNEYNEIETSMNGFYSSSLLRWAIDMYMPITRKLFAEVCGYGVLDDVILLHKTYKCKWGGTACKNAISNDHLHILEYLVLNDDGGIAYWYLIRCAVQNGKLDILIWILNKCYPENSITPKY
jgi:hypothetical protein